MLQSTMLAIKGAQLVVDCAGITAATASYMAFLPETPPRTGAGSIAGE